MTFVFFRNWDTKCQGGFHKFIDYTCDGGIETVFLELQEPYFIALMNDERLSKAPTRNPKAKKTAAKLKKK